MNAIAEDPRSLVDTNIVVYAYDLDDPDKHPVALELINRLSGQCRKSTEPCTSLNRRRPAAG